MTLRRAIKTGLVAAAGLLSTGCTDNNVSLYVRQVLGFQAGDAECVVEADPESFTIFRGFLDPAIPNDGFNAPVLFANQLVQRRDPGRLQAESNSVTIYEAEVEVFDFGGNSLRVTTQPVTGFAEPSTSGSPGYGVAFVRMLDGDLAAALSNQDVVSRVRLRGETAGGIEVESGPFDFPITVCTGCSTPIEPTSCDDEFLAFCDPAQSGQIDIRFTGIPSCASTNVAVGEVCLDADTCRRTTKE